MVLILHQHKPQGMLQNLLPRIVQILWKTVMTTIRHIHILYFLISHVQYYYTRDRDGCQKGKIPIKAGDSFLLITIAKYPGS